MTRSEYAKHRGVSAPAVTQWAAKGRIECDEDGNVLVESSDQRLAQTRDTRGGKRKPKPDVRSEPEQAGLEFDGTYVDANIRDRLAAARLKEMEFAERAKLLVERSQYDKALADAIEPILSRLDSVASRVAPGLLGQTDIRRIIEAIDLALIEFRQEISDNLRALAAGGEVH